MRIAIDPDTDVDTYLDTLSINDLREIARRSVLRAARIGKANRGKTRPPEHSKAISEGHRRRREVAAAAKNTPAATS